MTSSVSHELVTPIKCVVTFGEEIVASLKEGKIKKNASRIVSTGKLLLTQVKMLLDRGLLENGQFVPQIARGHLLKLLKETTQILEA